MMKSKTAMRGVPAAGSIALLTLGASLIYGISSGIGSTVFSPLIQALTAMLGLLGTTVFSSVPSLILLPVSLYLCRPSDSRTVGRREKRKR